MRLAQRATDVRLSILDGQVRLARGKARTVRVERLVDCFLQPYFDSDLNGILLAEFILQHRVQPSPMTEHVYAQHLDPFAQQFIDALCLTDKAVPRDRWVRRYTLMAGAVVLTMTDWTSKNRRRALSGSSEDASRGDELQCNLKQFLYAALGS